MITEFTAKESSRRIESLYADWATLKLNNEEGYAANVNWWKNLLLKLCVGSVCFNVDDQFRDQFRLPAVGVPLSLGSVILDMQRTSEMIPLSTFISSASRLAASASLSSRLTDAVVLTPTKYLLRRAGILEDPSSLSAEIAWKRACQARAWVIISRVKGVSQAILDLQRSQSSFTSSVYTMDEFKDQFESAFGGTGKQVPSPDDWTAVLAQLEMAMQKIVVDGNIVKFLLPSDEPYITDVDRGLVSLRSTLKLLQTQIDELSSKIDNKTEEINKYLKSKNRVMAMSALKSRNGSQALLSKRLDSQIQLETVHRSLEQSIGDAQMIEVFKSSSSALKTMLGKSELQRDNVEETMDAVRESVANQQELHDIINYQQGSVEEESELDSELAAFEKQLNEEKQEQKISQPSTTHDSTAADLELRRRIEALSTKSFESSSEKSAEDRQGRKQKVASE